MVEATKKKRGRPTKYNRKYSVILEDTEGCSPRSAQNRIQAEEGFDLVSWVFSGDYADLIFRDSYGNMRKIGVLEQIGRLSGEADDQTIIEKIKQAVSLIASGANSKDVEKWLRDFRQTLPKRKERGGLK